MSDITENLYPTSSEYFAPEEPEEQLNSRKNEEANVAKDSQIIGEVIEQLNTSISFYRSIDAIPDAVLLNPEEAAQTIMGNKKAVAVLESEKDKLISLVESIRRSS